MSRSLKNKKIILGVTGSIAAYKACIILRSFKKAGAEVRVIMTDAACHFIDPMTFEVLSQNAVITEMFPPFRVMRTEHVNWAEWADVILVCPATANCIGKVTAGIADDFLLTLIMAARTPVVFAPAMDMQMVQNPVYQNNCLKLRELGYHFIESGTGDLASGLEGPGRLAEPVIILNFIKKILARPTRIVGKKILISAGPTREPIDPVRFISNRSSGKMGIALAEEAFLRGAHVRLVLGPVSEPVMNGIETVHVETALEMEENLQKYWPDYDILVMSAAVADYAPKTVQLRKIKKSESPMNIEFKPTPDILKSVSRVRDSQLLVGFALESENSVEHALKKLAEKNLDLICLNEIGRDGTEPFGSEISKITLIDRDRVIEELPMMQKSESSEHIWNKIESLMDTK